MEHSENSEPLRSVLSLYQNKDKVLRHYLPSTTVKLIGRHGLFDEADDMLYLNDNLILVSKTTGLSIGMGKIIRISGTRVTLKTRYDNMSFDIEESYPFIKHKKQTNTDKREMFRAILQNMS